MQDLTTRYKILFKVISYLIMNAQYDSTDYAVVQTILYMETQRFDHILLYA